RSVLVNTSWFASIHLAPPSGKQPAMAGCFCSEDLLEAVSDLRLPGSLSPLRHSSRIARDSSYILLSITTIARYS
ncbi:MAG TPA: hypothetical protein VD947_02380, partial [Patescibacteria group bacterium]|nr:hypothetical protein [Patescibacteria group bacterium]